MDAARWQRVQTLFHQLLELDEQQRRAFLDEHCARDPSLRAKLDALIAADNEATEFFNEGRNVSVPDTQAAVEDDENIGRSLGQYRLIRRLGEGGMGLVYLAERTDGEFEQKSAIKLVRTPWFGPQLHARFLAERQILARLEHPCIARLLDGGTTPLGQPYLVMEYVDGVPVDIYCDQKDLDTRQRLELFLKVCDAVAYAHGQLVVHRDIKPANILVAPDGSPKLLDFGIARLIDTESNSAELTIASGQALTPEYASPEQVRGEPVTTVSDVYSLGVLLYRLLSGTLPYRFKTRTPQEIERVVCDTVPTRPSVLSAQATRERGPALRRELSGDLDTIVMNALRKTPQRRYASVAGLGDDIRRYLDCRPILARPASRSYVLGKFLRRNRASVSAAAAALLALVAGSVLAVWGMLTAQVERDRAEVEAFRAEQTSEFLTNMLSSVNPDYSRGADTELLKRLLGDAALRVPLELADQPSVRGDIEAVIGRAYLMIGELERAWTHLSAANELAQETRDEHRLLQTRLSLARHAAYSREPATGLERLETLLSEADRLPPEDPLRLRALGLKAQFLMDLNRLDQAESVHLDILHHSEGSTDPAVIDTRLGALLSTVQILARRGEFEQALVRLEQTQCEAQRWLDPAAWRYRQWAVSLEAILYLMRQDYASGIPLLRRSIALQEEHFGPDHPFLIAEINNLANALKSSGQFEQARAPFEQALAMARDNHGPDHWMSLQIQGTHADLLRILGETEAAVTSLREALTLADASLPAEHPQHGVIRRALGQAELALGEQQTGIALLEESVWLLSDRLGPEHPETAQAREALIQAQTALDPTPSP
jgi:eukaryotic-like serine/threonine-protein kinase